MWFALLLAGSVVLMLVQRSAWVFERLFGRPLGLLAMLVGLSDKVMCELKGTLRDLVNCLRLLLRGRNTVEFWIRSFMKFRVWRSPS